MKTRRSGLWLAALASINAALADPAISFRKCVNFQGSYAGSWLGSPDMYKDVPFRDRAALEFATRDLYNRAHGRKGSGYKTNGALKARNEPDLTDFMVMHISGIEHALVRKFGYAKGLALTNLTTTHAYDVTLARHTKPATQGDPAARGPKALELLGRSVAVIPFFGGAASVTTGKDGKVVDTMLPSGAGNSHTLAPTEMKVMQLAAVVLAATSYFGTAVVGVVSPAEAALVRDGLRRLLPPLLLSPSRVRLQELSCGANSVYLPYRLLTWVQHAYRSGGLPAPAPANSLLAKAGAGVGAGVGIGVGGGIDVGGARRRRLEVSSGGARVYGGRAMAAQAATAAAMTTEQQQQRRRQQRQQRQQRQRRLKDRGHDDEDIGDGRGKRAFDLVYYTEADNVVFMSHHEAVAAASIAFLDSNLGGTSFIAPNRLEYNGRCVRRSLLVCCVCVVLHRVV